MRRGYFLRNSCVPKPSLSVAPGAKFWTNTSAFSSKRWRTNLASARFKSSVRDSLERFNQTKWLDNPRTVASYPRAKSPSPGRSTLMTRAPRSANCRVANGAATACSSETMVIPSRGNINTTAAGPEHAPPSSSESSSWKLAPLDIAGFRGICVRCRTLRQSRNLRTFVPRCSPAPRKRPPPEAWKYSPRGRTVCRYQTNRLREIPSGVPPPGWRGRERLETECPDFCRSAFQKRLAHSHSGKRVPGTNGSLRCIPRRSEFFRHSSCPANSGTPALPRRPNFPRELPDYRKTIRWWRGSSSCGWGESSNRAPRLDGDQQEWWKALRSVSSPDPRGLCER